MFSKRGSRGSSSRKKSNKCSILLEPKDSVRLQHTLDLEGIDSIKPCINYIMPIIVKRLDAEEEAAMLELARNWQRGISDCNYPGYDDELYDEIYGDFYSFSRSSRRLKELNKKLFKRDKGGRKKYRNNYQCDDDDFWNNRHTMYSNDEWCDGYKCIKFYRDIDNELDVHEFYSLKDFDDFCEENDYHVSPTDYSNLVNWSVIHCCLDPISEEYDEHEVITDNSYGGLYWTVSEDCVKSKDFSK